MNLSLNSNLELGINRYEKPMILRLELSKENFKKLFVGCWQGSSVVDDSQC